MKIEKIVAITLEGYLEPFVYESRKVLGVFDEVASISYRYAYFREEGVTVGPWCDDVMKAATELKLLLIFVGVVDPGSI